MDLSRVADYLILILIHWIVTRCVEENFMFLYEQKNIKLDLVSRRVLLHR